MSHSHIYILASVDGPGYSSNTNESLVKILVMAIRDSHSLMVVRSLDAPPGRPSWHVGVMSIVWRLIDR